MRNNYGPQPFGSMARRRGPREYPGSVPAGRFGQYADGQEPLQYEPEDGRVVPIADPPVPERGTEENGGGSGTCGGVGMLAGSPLAMVYAPDQAWQELYEGEEALEAGTLFRELNFPFCPGCRKSGR